MNPEIERGSKIVTKAWGFESIVTNNPLYCAKWLHIKNGWRCSSHSHRKKDEKFLVVEGACVIELNGCERIARVGDLIDVPPNTVHYFGVPAKWANCTLLEISTPHSDDDVFRVSPSRMFDD